MTQSPSLPELPKLPKPYDTGPIPKFSADQMNTHYLKGYEAGSAAAAQAVPEKRPTATEKDINRWQAAIQQRPEGPWEMGCGGSFDRTQIKPISDEMLAELAHWLRMGYTPWNGRSMPLSAADRQFMFMLYFSVQGLIARVRAAERIAASTQGAEGAAPQAVSMCPCGDRPAADCDEQWGPKCDLGNNAKYAEGAAPQADRDAYEGAREDLLDWKRRALKAEASLKAEQETTGQLTRALREAIEPPTFMGEPVVQKREAPTPTAPQEADALREALRPFANGNWTEELAAKARAALAQHQPQPVLAPVVREPLTEERLKRLDYEAHRDTGCKTGSWAHLMIFARAIERAHGIQATTGEQS